MDFKERFRELRGTRSKTEFAKELGITQQKISNYEYGIVKPTYEVFEKLAKAGINLNWLITGIGNSVNVPSQISRWDKEVAKRIKSLIQSHKIDENILIGTLNIPEPALSKMIKGEIPWQIQYLTNIAIYFNSPLEKLIYGEDDYITNAYAKNQKGFLLSLKKYLLDNNRHKDYVRLLEEGFFKKLEN